jgi:hypothetical protein
MRPAQIMMLMGGIAIGVTTLSIASVPLHRAVKDDTAIYQNLSEIRVEKQGRPNFDQDIQKLSQLEDNYQERLPSLAEHPRLKGPMKRVSQQKYSPSKKLSSSQ